MIVDAHAHVYEPDRFPYPDRAEDGAYRPRREEGGSIEAFRATLGRHAVTHAVLVQPSAYGTDNRALTAATAASAGRWKGIAVVPLDVPTDEVARLAGQGVVGIRLNFVNSRGLLAAGAALERLFATVQSLAWIVQVQCPAVGLPGLLPLLAGVERLVFDHCGYPDAAQPVSEPGFQALLARGRAGAAFVKLSGAFRLSRSGPPYEDVRPYAEAVLDSFGPSRCVWGSDWPFVNAPRRPDYRATLEILERWVPSAVDRGKILSGTPARLFGFAERTG